MRLLGPFGLAESARPGLGDSTGAGPLDPHRAAWDDADTLGWVNTPVATTTKVRALLGEVLRFLTVGGAATLVSLVGFNVLVHGLFIGAAPLANRPIITFVLVNVVAGVVAYVGMRAWAFRDRQVQDPATGLIRFFGLGALTMVVPVVCLWVSRHLLGLTGPVADNVAANVVGLGLSVVARFFVFRRYVFGQVAVPEPCRPAA